MLFSSAASTYRTALVSFRKCNLLLFGFALRRTEQALENCGRSRIRTYEPLACKAESVRLVPSVTVGWRANLAARTSQ
jgi:hypothetical protein